MKLPNIRLLSGTISIVLLISSSIPCTALSYTMLEAQARYYMTNTVMGVQTRTYESNNLNPSMTSESDSLGYGSYNISITPTPAVSVSLLPQNLENLEGSTAYAHLIYYYKILGEINTTVPIFLNYTVSLYDSSPHIYYQNTGKSGGAIASLYNTGTLIGDYRVGGWSSSNIPGELIYSNNATLFAQSNTDLFILLEVEAFNTSTGYVYASIDPTITIEQDYVAQGFTLLESPGVGNSPTSPTATPEPATMLLMGIGLAGGAIMRKRFKGLEM